MVHILSTIYESITGDSSPKWIITPSGKLTGFDESWTGVIQVKKNLQDPEPIASHTMERATNGSYMRGFFLPEDTKNLKAGTIYNVIIQLDSPTIDPDGAFSAEIQFKWRIYQEGIL